ncbi:insulin-like peptide receptor isoform X2 [Antedon mediterranea]|uniref:insulin-like peptide receptor isoform X2 n=1 Tax=Antedon mediterranea TaxID=105859 RepID=UPI003AF9ED3F
MIYIILKNRPSWLMLFIFLMTTMMISLECHAQQGRAPSEINRTRDEVACTSINVRNDISYLARFINCTVVEGYVQIVLMEDNREEDVDIYTLPNLIEITDYLLLYRVTKLKTLSKLFPNLAVINGQNLLYHYSLIIFDMFDLEEVGLQSLVNIKRGAVRIEKNPVLCYIDTIEWSLISEEHKENSFFGFNKDQGLCFNNCPDPAGTCSRTLANGQTKQLCWNDESCQKVCPPECRDNCFDENTCCSELCIAGCSKPSSDPYHCNACRYFISYGQCVRKCPRSYLVWHKHRCVTMDDCITYFGFWYKSTNECVDRCPSGYTANNKSKCERCKIGNCGIDPHCKSKQPIKSLEDAEIFKDCTFIEGSLEIEIKNSANIRKGLEESLGKVEVVSGFVSVSHSYPLVTLDFLKSLREIQAKELKNNKYAFYVLENRNLEKIFSNDNHVNITVGNNSKLSFHENPKLCISEIKKFQKLIQGAAPLTDIDISPSSNGHQKACKVNMLDLDFDFIESNYIHVIWKNRDDWTWDDPRTVLGYQVLWRETDLKNLTFLDGVGSCGDGGLWESQDVSPDKDRALIIGLKSWKQYGMYVKAFVIKGKEQGAQSEIVYFRTLESSPSEPVKLQVSDSSVNTLSLSWKPPTILTGNITKYRIEYNKRRDDFSSFAEREFCGGIPKPSLVNTEIEEEDETEPPPSSDDDCTCKKDEQTIIDEDLAKERSEFENTIHSKVYLSSFLGQRKRRSIRSVGLANSTINDPAFPTKDNGIIVMNETSEASVPPTTTLSVEYEPVINHTIFTEIVLQNLDYFSEYIIRVSACLADGRCGEAMYTVARTKAEDNVDDIPGNINVSYVDDNADDDNAGYVLVKWQTPLYPNGPVLYFTVSHHLSGDDPDRQGRQDDGSTNNKGDCVQFDEYAKIGGYKINDLEPGNYTITVQAMTLGGVGSWTAPVSVIVPHPPAKEPPAVTQQNIKLMIIITVAVSAVIVLFIVLASGWYLKRKYGQTQMPDGVLYASVNPEYLSTADMYVPDASEFPRDQLEIIHELGKGSFGMVYQGLAKNIIDGEKVSDVAVKSVQANASMRDRIEFLNEASVMKAITTHHIVKLLGVVSKGQPTYVIMEYMAQGDLKNWLRNRRPENQADLPAHERKLPPDLKDILRMATEVADGMAFLTYSKYVHRDLSARNCLVSADGTCKVADFGLARDIYQSDYYRKERGGLLPIRWMAPESIKDGVFQSASDVWSYGVLLWEMATLCELPYQGLSNEEAGEYIKNGNTLPKPEGCPQRIHDLMIMCWQFQEKHRPSFVAILKNFEDAGDFSDHFHLMSYYHNDLLAYDSMENLNEEELEGISILDKSNDCGCSSRGSDSPRYVERPTMKEENNGLTKNGMLHYNGQQI